MIGKKEGREKHEVVYRGKYLVDQDDWEGKRKSLKVWNTEVVIKGMLCSK